MSEERLFEQVFIDYNSGNYRAEDILNDNQLLSYKIWENENWQLMYESHFPNTRVFRGQNPNIIYHAHCLGCIRQRIEGLETCKGCSYFRRDPTGKKEDKKIGGEDCSSMSSDEFNKIFE